MTTTAGWRHVEHVMGTVVSIDVRDPRIPRTTLLSVLGWLHWVDATFSTYQSDSAINRLSRGEIDIVDCPPEITEVLGLCAEITATTDGYFQATADGRLDPTGVVKGWAIERAHEILVAAGSRAHLVTGGGDLRAHGEPSAEPRPWCIGIADPHRPGELAAMVAGTDIAVATSGTAERGGHIINPYTGRPATDLASVSVIGPDLIHADAYATAAVAMERIDWLDDLGYSAFAIDSAGERRYTASCPVIEIAPQHRPSSGSSQDSFRCSTESGGTLRATDGAGTLRTVPPGQEERDEIRARGRTTCQHDGS